MSAIAGMYWRNGRTAERMLLERMLAVLAHRGPDGTGLWLERSIGLGHQMLWTTPASVGEVLPRANARGDIVVTADARIDNRNDLISELNLGNRPPSSMSDSELILSAYERWGTSCPEHLLGDFAFAIWDSRQRTLFCSRDQLGIKPLYYHHSEDYFAFATEMKALIEIYPGCRSPNEEIIADFLTGVLANQVDTFYSGIRRLPPAHSMTFGADGVRTWQYWSLDPDREIRLQSDDQYAAAFRELFTEAVRCRLRSDRPVGSLLSGGLDSSSIAAVASHLLEQAGAPALRTLSAQFDSVPESSERRYQVAVLARLDVRSQSVRADQISPLQDVERVLWHQEGPPWGPGLYIGWALYHAANDQGIRVLLDGHGGDEVVSHGYGYLTELAQAGRWLSLARESRGIAKLHNDRYLSLLWNCSRASLLRSPFRRRLYRRGTAFRRRMFPERRQVPTELLNPDFARRTQAVERFNRDRRDHVAAIQSARTEHQHGITHGRQAFALETLDKDTAAHRIEGRYPFLDRRIVEFCASLPARQKLRNGSSRFVLRQAMTGILPHEVQWRPDKASFTPALCQGLRQFERARLDDLIYGNTTTIGQYVDLGHVRGAYERFIFSETSPSTAQDVLVLWRVIGMSLWLESIDYSVVERTRNQREERLYSGCVGASAFRHQFP